MTLRGLFPGDSRYLRIFGATAISALGDGVQLVAFPLLATTLTKSPTVIAGLAAVGALPYLVLALPAGALVDRLDRARLLVVIDLCRAVITALLAAMVITRTIRLWELFAFALALGAGALLYNTGATAYLPMILQEHDLGRANGQLSTVSNFGDGLIGPAVGGIVFAAFASLPFTLNACSFLVSALLVLNMARAMRATARPQPEPSAEDAPHAAEGSFTGQIAQGLRWMIGKRSLRGLLCVIAAWNLLGWMPEATLVLYAQRDLGLGGFGYGLLFAAPSAGAVIGGLLSGRLLDKLGSAVVLQASVIMYSALMFPAAVLHSPALVIAAFAIQGLPLVAWSVVTTTLRQILVPNALLGRVSSVFQLLSGGLAPVGLMLGGVFGQWLGLRQVFALAGAGIIVVTLINLGSLRLLAREAEHAMRTDAAPKMSSAESGQPAPGVAEATP
jgi:MFS family permease